jgi:hypothetical protein
MLEIRDKYRHLELHLLPSITQSTQSFCDSAVALSQVLVINMNVQSINSQSGDVETDLVIQCCDYLALSESWVRDDQETIRSETSSA